MSLTSAILKHKCTPATPSKLPSPSTVPSIILEAKCIQATHQPKSIIATPSRISLPSLIPAAPGKQPPPNGKVKTLAFKLRQQKTAHQEQATAAITVENCNFTFEKCEEQWVSELTERDQAVLTENDWVTDNVTDTARGLLKKQFIHINGLQIIVVGLTLSYAIQTEEFIQVLYTGRGHWVTVSTIGVEKEKLTFLTAIPQPLHHTL